MWNTFATHISDTYNTSSSKSHTRNTSAHYTPSATRCIACPSSIQHSPPFTNRFARLSWINLTIGWRRWRRRMPRMYRSTLFFRFKMDQPSSTSSCKCLSRYKKLLRSTLLLTRFIICVFASAYCCDHALSSVYWCLREVGVEMLLWERQNRRQKVFNRGALRFCGEAWHSKNGKNLNWFVVFHTSFWGS